MLFPAPVGVAPEVLVVAVPQHRAGVRREPCDLLTRLGLDLGGEHLLGIGRAREREVLPHQQTALVAHVVERVGLVEAATPHPHQVHVRVQRLAQPLAVPRRAGARDERVVGDPVDAAREHRPVVDPRHERRAEVVGRGVVPSTARTPPARRRPPPSP
jgi:hypothetical protein